MSSLYPAGGAVGGERSTHPHPCFRRSQNSISSHNPHTYLYNTGPRSRPHTLTKYTTVHFIESTFRKRSVTINSKYHRVWSDERRLAFFLRVPSGWTAVRRAEGSEQNVPSEQTPPVRFQLPHFHLSAEPRWVDVNL